jgi:predicted TIM-barrel fold metal-dependent hydrolase
VAKALPEPAATAAWDCHVHVFDGQTPTLGGHYAPAAATLEDIQTLSASHGLSRLVLVQPSVYGDNPSVMLAALRRSAGQHRGVVVAHTPQAAQRVVEQADTWHALGVRGVRFNCVSPVGAPPDATALRPVLRTLQATLQRLRWHVQWYVQPAQWPLVAALQADMGGVHVLDHVGGLRPGTPLQADRTAALNHLAQGGAWLKLSGWYRLGCAPPYAELTAQIEHMAALFAGRCVWGSDWPHTGTSAAAVGGHAALLAVMHQALQPQVVQHALREAPWVLYA